MRHYHLCKKLCHWISKHKNQYRRYTWSCWFSSEVERIIKTVDSVLLLFDSSEGPMSQTQVVIEKYNSLQRIKWFANFNVPYGFTNRFPFGYENLEFFMFDKNLFNCMTFFHLMATTIMFSSILIQHHWLTFLFTPICSLW